LQKQVARDSHQRCCCCFVPVCYAAHVR
jgi:hypothetical protein